MILNNFTDGNLNFLWIFDVSYVVQVVIENHKYNELYHFSVASKPLLTFYVLWIWPFLIQLFPKIF